MGQLKSGAKRSPAPIFALVRENDFCGLCFLADACLPTGKQGRAASHPNAQAGREGKGVWGKKFPSRHRVRHRRILFFASQKAPQKRVLPCPKLPVRGQ